MLDTILNKLGLHLSDLNDLAEHFSERELIDVAFDVYVARRSGDVEREFESEPGEFGELGKLVLYEQMLHELFKRKVYQELFLESDEDEDEEFIEILFDNNYSKFTSYKPKHSGYAGAIVLTEKLPNEIVMKIVSIAKKCKLAVVKN